jgi:hypothetical protein
MDFGLRCIFLENARREPTPQTAPPALPSKFGFIDVWIMTGYPISPVAARHLLPRTSNGRAAYRRHSVRNSALYSH